MNLDYRVSDRPEYESGPKRDDFKRRTEEMYEYMKVAEKNLDEIIVKLMTDLAEKHKRLFTKEEGGLVGIPDYLGIMVWPDGTPRVNHTRFFADGM